MAHVSAEADPRAQTAMELTHLMVQKHYCENDPEAVIAQMDEDFLWFGAGEQEYLAGKSAVAETFSLWGKCPGATFQTRNTTSSVSHRMPMCAQGGCGSPPIPPPGSVSGCTSASVPSFAG